MAIFLAVACNQVKSTMLLLSVGYKSKPLFYSLYFKENCCYISFSWILLKSCAYKESYMHAQRAKYLKTWQKLAINNAHHNSDVDCMQYFEFKMCSNKDWRQKCKTLVLVWILCTDTEDYCCSVSYLSSTSLDYFYDFLLFHLGCSSLPSFTNYHCIVMAILHLKPEMCIWGLQ